MHTGTDGWAAQVQQSVEGINFLDSGYSILATAVDGVVLAAGVWDREGEEETTTVRRAYAAVYHVRDEAYRPRDKLNGDGHRRKMLFVFESVLVGGYATTPQMAGNTGLLNVVCLRYVHTSEYWFYCGSRDTTARPRVQA